MSETDWEIIEARFARLKHFAREVAEYCDAIQKLAPALATILVIVLYSGSVGFSQF